MPSALLLILGGDIPGLVAVTPASAAAAKFAYAMTADPGTVSGIQSAAFLLTQLVTASGTYHRPPDSSRTERPAAGAGIVQTI